MVQVIDFSADDTLIRRFGGGSVLSVDLGFHGRLAITGETNSTIHIEPVDGDTFPVFDGENWSAATFVGPTDSVGAGCAVPSAVGSYDVLGALSGLVIGPAWPSSDLSARGLSWRNGRRVHALGSYLGSINVSVAGQVTCNQDYGQNRKWEVWNAYNQQPVNLHVGQVFTSYVPTNQYPNWLPLNGDANNRANVFCGLPTDVQIDYHQNFFINSTSGQSGLLGVILWDGVNLGHNAIGSSDVTTMASSLNGNANFRRSGVVGLHTATMGIAKANTATSSAFGGVNITPPSPYTAIEGNSVLYARWMA